MFWSSSETVLLWLPGPFEIVCQARIPPWVEENQQRAMSRSRSNQSVVAAFNDPSSLRIDEASKRQCDRLMRALHGNFPGLPEDRVQLEVRQALPRGKDSGVCALSGTRVAEDKNFHAA